MRKLTAIIVPALLALACGGAPDKQPSGASPKPSGQAIDGTSASTSAGESASSEGDHGETAPGWRVVYDERFEGSPLALPAWQPDQVPDDGPFADDGAYFRNQGIHPPAAFRISQPFGASNWLTLESYTRDAQTPPSSLAAIVVDPADPANHALRIDSPRHTDATVVRPTQPLPERYRVSVRVGFADFGDGKPGLNGYQGGETAEPWLPDSSIGQNGFYWLAILDAPPRPHNNLYIHHHRKVVMDSDNNTPPWMEQWNGSAFAPNGEHPLMMFALDGTAPSQPETGKPFLPYAEGEWQPSGTVRAVDQYLPGEWYTATIERDGTVFTLSVSGRFKNGGQTTYTARIDAAAHCVWHFNRTGAEDASACLDESSLPGLDGNPLWPAGTSWPDWFMFGDPHVNFYEGSVLYDDVKLEVWQD